MSRRTEVVVGAVILLGLVVIVLGTAWLMGVDLGREEIRVQALFREVGQLQVGNTVKLRGVPIGRVEAIELDSGGTGVLVMMRIKRDVPLPEDPVVLLSPESLFGDWQAQIFPRSRFPRYSYAESPDPGVLAGYSLPDISELTAVIDEIAGNLATLTDRVELAFTEETAINIRLAIENIQEVSGQLTGLVGRQQRAIDEVAAGLSRTAELLGGAAASAQRAFLQVEAAVADGALAEIVGNVQRATAQVDSLSTELLAASREFRSAMAHADSVMDAVGAIAERLERGEGSLGRLFQDTTLYTDLVRSNVLLQELLADIKENPGRYIRLKIF